MFSLIKASLNASSIISLANLYVLSSNNLGMLIEETFTLTVKCLLLIEVEITFVFSFIEISTVAIMLLLFNSFSYLAFKVAAIFLQLSLIVFMIDSPHFYILDINVKSFIAESTSYVFAYSE